MRVTVPYGKDIIHSNDSPPQFSGATTRLNLFQFECMILVLAREIKLELTSGLFGNFQLPPLVRCI